MGEAGTVLHASGHVARVGHRDSAQRLAVHSGHGDIYNNTSGGHASYDARGRNLYVGAYGEPIRCYCQCNHLLHHQRLRADGFAPAFLGKFAIDQVVLLNPLIYVAEGMRAGLTEASHMPLYVIYPVLIAFCAFFLGLGLRNFRRRVLV